MYSDYGILWNCLSLDPTGLIILCGNIGGCSLFKFILPRSITSPSTKGLAHPWCTVSHRSGSPTLKTERATSLYYIVPLKKRSSIWIKKSLANFKFRLIQNVFLYLIRIIITISLGLATVTSPWICVARCKPALLGHDSRSNVYSIDIFTVELYLQLLTCVYLHNATLDYATYIYVHNRKPFSDMAGLLLQPELYEQHH